MYVYAVCLNAFVYGRAWEMHCTLPNVFWFIAQASSALHQVGSLHFRVLQCSHVL
jgi:hypothetical protein